MKLYRRLDRVVLALLLLAAFCALFYSPAAPTVNAAGETTAIVHAMIYTSPTEPPIKDGVVVIRGDKIAAVGAFGKVEIPSGSVLGDANGRVITAGFQNSHAHFEPNKWPDPEHQSSVQLEKKLTEMLTQYGVTTAVDLGSILQNTVAIRRRIEAGEVIGPRILTAGAPLYPPDGIPYYLRERLPADILKLFVQPDTPHAAVQAVSVNIDGGADVIKLFTGTWVERGKVKPMPVEIAKAAVAEAHRRGRMVFTHPSNLEGLQVALDAHVDVLAHAIQDLRGWDPTYLTRMKAANMALIPTLILFDGDEHIAEIEKEVFDYERAGGQILFGTDVGYQEDYSPEQEYVLMARAGLSPMQILASLTTAAAERFGEANRRGRIAPGMDADLVELNADPAVDAKNFAVVCATYRAGRPIFARPRALEAGSATVCK
jgi:imidazolonepropionase-like amidohydrolase